jgi:hypothetical protein
MQVKEVPLAEVRLDGGTQPRQQIDLSVVADYAADMDAGADFPPGEAVFDGTYHWLFDGFHRLHAERRRESTTVRLNVRPGTVEDARWLALGANKAHGLRRTNEDKRQAVEVALRMRPQESNRAIAGHCGVTHPFVGGIRAEVTGNRFQSAAPEPLSNLDNRGAGPTERIVQSPERTGRDGRTINTANIGKRKEPPRPDPGEPPPPSLLFPAEAEEAAEAEEPDEEVGEAVADALEEPQPPPTPQGRPAATAPAHPYSDSLIAWLRDVFKQTYEYRMTQGGIGRMLAQRQKWDWHDVRAYILPQLGDLEKLAHDFREEIARAAQQG